LEELILIFESKGNMNDYKEEIEAVQQLNDKYLNDELRDEGCSFVLVIYEWGCLIEFCDLRLWDSESDEREWDDEKDEYAESIFEYCEKEWNRFRKAIG